MEWNRMEWNGFSKEMNGMEWNRMEFKNLVWMLYNKLMEWKVSNTVWK